MLSGCCVAVCAQRCTRSSTSDVLMAVCEAGLLGGRSYPMWQFPCARRVRAHKAPAVFQSHGVQSSNPCEGTDDGLRGPGGASESMSFLQLAHSVHHCEPLRY